MSQPTLFDALPPAARASDPHTSHLAASHARVRRQTQLGRLLAAYAHDNATDGLTDEMAAMNAGLSMRSCWWKRCSELRALELIDRCGTGISSTGEKVMVCKITRLGVLRYHAMIHASRGDA